MSPQFMNLQMHQAGRLARIWAGLLIVPVLLAAGCHPAQPPPAMPPPQVSVETVAREAVPVTTELPGRIDAISDTGFDL